MLDLKAAGGNPCSICRFIVLALIVSILGLSPYNGLEDADFFGLRHYVGDHVPPAADLFLVFLYAAVIWIMCERVIVERFIRKRPAGSDKSHVRPRGPRS